MGSNDKPGVDGPRGGRGRVLLDMVLNLTSYGASMLSMLLYSPYLVSHLGVAAYGFVPLMMSAVQYLGIFTSSLQISASRALAQALEEGNDERASVVLSTILLALLVVFLVLGPGVIWLAFQVDSLLRIPPGIGEDVRLLAFGSLSMFLLGALASILELVVYIQSRFDLRSGMTVVTIATRVGVPVLLFEAIAPRLRYVGVGLAASAMVHLILAAWSARRLLPSLRLTWRLASLSVLWEVWTVGGWTMATQLGVLLFLNADLLVLNRVLGPQISGQYALVQVWVTLLISVGSSVSGVFGPRLLGALVGERDTDARLLAEESVKTVALIMALPVGLVSGFAEPLLTSWQGASFAHLAPLLSLVVLPFGLSLGYQPLASVFLGRKALQLPAIVQLVAGLASVTGGYLLARYTHLGLWSPVLVGGTIQLLRSCGFTPLYAARLLGLPRLTFLRLSLFALAATLAVAVLSRQLGAWLRPLGWLQLGAAASMVCILHGVGLWFLLFRSRGPFPPLWRRP
ncbi:MAG: lipopolysaccharide biosynthesis protein [Myxococcales bacterium]|nr:lipopolysaccharide biosynthesis protein [Polyangiaceae bacterium]MDW8250492.1 lipopolysaccharide biosynthesis protein [Myxococcales bacterium]